MRYRILDAEHEPVAELKVRSAPPQRRRVTTVVLERGVEVREGGGREPLLFHAGVAEGRTVQDAVASGWAAVQRRRRSRRVPLVLTERQNGSLTRLFRDHLRIRAGDE